MRSPDRRSTNLGSIKPVSRSRQCAQTPFPAPPTGPYCPGPFLVPYPIRARRPRPLRRPSRRLFPNCLPLRSSHLGVIPPPLPLCDALFPNCLPLRGSHLGVIPATLRWTREACRSPSPSQSRDYATVPFFPQLVAPPSTRSLSHAPRYPLRVH